MEIPIKFAGGPLDGQTAKTDGLAQAKIFFDDRDRRVHLYIRVDELVYGYSHEQSVALTGKYDEAKEKFSSKEPDGLRFMGDEQDED
jgi:hypothetical protein